MQRPSRPCGPPVGLFVLMGWLCAVAGLGRLAALSFNDDSSWTNHLSPPPGHHRFHPWTPCDSYGAVGVAKSGAALGETNRDVAVWPVGPFAFVHSRHVNPQPDSHVLFRGRRYDIVESHELGNDAVLLVVTNVLPGWNAVWRGFHRTTTFTTNWWAPPAPRLAMVSSNHGPVSIRHLPIMAISGGPSGTTFDGGGCSPQAGSFAKRWGYGTNAWISDVHWPFVLQALVENRYSTVGTFGPTISVPFVDRAGTSQFGARLGDSGGAFFIYEDGTWWLAGLIHSGGYCRSSSVSAPILYESLHFQDDFYTAVRQSKQIAVELWANPNARRGEFHRRLRERYFATTPSYDDCPDLPPAVPAAARPASASR